VPTHHPGPHTCHISTLAASTRPHDRCQMACSTHVTSALLGAAPLPLRSRTARAPLAHHVAGAPCAHCASDMGKVTCISKTSSTPGR
jgi:hypothetical protein